MLEYFHTADPTISDLIPDFKNISTRDIESQAIVMGVPMSEAIAARKNYLTQAFNAASLRVRENAAHLLATDHDPEFSRIFADRAMAIAAKLDKRLTAELARLDSHNRPAKPGEITSADIDDARAYLIEDLLNDRGYPVLKTRSDCPLCGGKQSAKVLPSNRFYCHRCGAKHDSIGLVMSLDDIPFLNSVRQIIGK